MEFAKVKGNTYYIQAPTNIGVYVFENRNCLLVDTGSNNGQAGKIAGILAAENLHLKYIINTHSHTDHCGGNCHLQSSYPGCLVYASEAEKNFMEKPDLYSMLIRLVGALNYIEPPALHVDCVLENGINKFDDQEFTAIPLPGHTFGQVGLITPDRVCFPGDAVFSRSIIEEHSIPYLSDVGESIRTLIALRDVDADYFVISHAEKPVNRGELLDLIDFDLAIIEKYREQILKMLDRPMSKEGLIENFILLNNLNIKLFEFHLITSAVSSYLKYLYESKLIDNTLKNGRLYYYKKER